MEHPLFTSSGRLDIRPSAGSSKNDFDFYQGKWTIRNRRLKKRLSNCTEWEEFEADQEMSKILDGNGNIDFFHARTGNNVYEGMALRLFNPASRLWSIYWADNKKVELDTPVKGSFENKIGHFYAEDIWEGREIIIRFCWDVTNSESPVWSQAFSTDRGESWEWNWYMYMQRRTNTTGNKQ